MTDCLKLPGKPKPPKHVLVDGKRIHLRFVQQIIWGAVAAAIGAYMVSALYYLITQVRYGGPAHPVFYLKPTWDHLFKYGWWPDARHDYRDCYEGVFATLFVKSIISKKKHWVKKPVGAFRLATAPLLLFVAAFPVITLGIWVVDIHNASVPATIHTYQSFLIGFVAAQVVHRLYAPVGNTVQLFLVDEARSLGWKVSQPWYPPVVRERKAWLDSINAPHPKHGTWIRIVIVGLCGILLALAVYGAYVRLVVARG